MTRRLLPGGLATVVATALVLSGCGDGAGGGSARPAPAGTPTVSTSPGSAPTTAEPGHTVTVTETVTATPPTKPTLPGVRVAGPAKNSPVAVFGVTAPDTLRLRARPGTDQPVIRGLAPTERHAVATGAARRVGKTVWWQLRVHGSVGWSSSAYLSRPADTVDVTSAVVTKLGKTPSGETMSDLGLTVARARGSTDPASRYVLAVRPTVGDLGEITIDVIGLGDDSVAGERLHVFGTRGEESFTLKSVEATPMCARGVVNGTCL